MSVTVEVVSHNVGSGSAEQAHLLGCRADALTLQECIEPEYQALLLLGWHGAFAPMREAWEDRSGHRKGLAVLSRHPIVETRVVFLGTGPKVRTDKDFNLLCVSIDHPAFRDSEEALWVATTHLWSAGRDEAGDLYSTETNDAVRLHQAKKIARYLEPRIEVDRYVLTGDFNTGPRTRPIDQLHGVTRSGAIGVRPFWEADQSHSGKIRRGGRDTVDGDPGRNNGRKIDYWFASRGGIPAKTGVDLDLHPAKDNGGAPHDRVLVGRATWPRPA